MSWIVLMMLACGGADDTVAEAPVAAEAAAAAPEAPAEKTARRVFFISPEDGATVRSPVTIKMGVEGKEVRPAGEVVEGTGHHHIIIAPAGIAEGEVIPADETHIHFGQGQTEAELELPPGEHKLTMQFADGAHVSFGEELAATITITVEE